MNKKYITPAVEVYNVNNTSILAGSINEGSNPIDPTGTITSPNDVASKILSGDLSLDVDTYTE